MGEDIVRTTWKHVEVERNFYPPEEIQVIKVTECFELGHLDIDKMVSFSK